MTARYLAIRLVWTAIFVCVFSVIGCSKKADLPTDGGSTNTNTDTSSNNGTTNETSGTSIPSTPTSTTAPTSYKLTAMVEPKSISRPTDIAFLPGSTTAFFVISQNGRIYFFNGTTTPANSIDLAPVITSIDSGEQGLLNLEFHPDYASNNFVFFYHTSRENTVNSVSRMKLVVENGKMVLSDLVRIIDMRKGTSAVAHNHNGGGMVFAPDKTLLLSVGDGGGDSTSAQSSKRLLGKVLRISPSVVAGSGGYTIPNGNRFSASNALCSDVATSNTDCPEILAMGLRNPFRMSIDGNTVYLGDVGYGMEEINSFDYNSSSFVNFGWPTHDGPATNSSITGYKNPALAYSRSDSTANRFRQEDPNGRKTGDASLIIGDVIRSNQYGGALIGHLIHGEFMDGFIRAQAVANDGSTTGSGFHLAHHDGVVAMIQGPDGFVYIATQGGAWGTTGPDSIYRIDPGP